MDITTTRNPTGWSRRTTAKKPFKRRTLVAPLSAAFAISIAHIFFGATQPMAALFFSASLVICVILAAGFSGPRYMTPAMFVAPALLFAYLVSGLAGPLRHAAPDAAVLLAALSAWTIGFISARQRSTMDIFWAGLIWASLVYTIWIFFSQIGTSLGVGQDGRLTAGLGSPTEASVMFGFLALLGSARVMHVIKQMDAEALSRSEMVDRLLRDALGGLLLFGFALTCLAMTGSRVGALITGGVLVAHCWWDLRAILQREHRGGWVRMLGRIAPIASVLAMVLGVALGYLRDESVASGSPGTSGFTHIQRLETYWAAWRASPFVGHGLGGIDTITARMENLQNFSALNAFGDARNMPIRWLVETGIVGLLIGVSFVTAAHISIARVFRHHNTPRTFPRLAIMSGAYLALHGIADSSLAIPSLLWLYALVLGCACGIAAIQAAKDARAPA